MYTSPVQKILQLVTQLCTCQGHAARVQTSCHNTFMPTAAEQYAYMQHTPAGSLLVYKA